MCTLGFHRFSLYTRELNFEQTILDKTQARLGTSRGMHLGTLWELVSLPPPSKRKKLDRSWVHAEPPHWLHEICVGHHFSCRLMSGTEFWGHSEDPWPWKFWGPVKLIQCNVSFFKSVTHLGWRLFTRGLKDLAKFVYKSKRKMETFRVHGIFWLHARAYCLNMVMSKFVFPHNMVTVSLF